MCSERERFEAWVNNPHKLDKSTSPDDCGEYTHPWTRGAWEAWQAACPKGWQCVPVEPTDEMTKAGTWSGNGDVSVSEEWARKTVYGRMLSAAPKPEDS